MMIPEIIKSIKFIWNRSDLIPKSNIYFQRVQTGTVAPYMKINCSCIGVESVSGDADNLNTYRVDIQIWGDESMLNSSSYSNALSTMMNKLPVNTPLAFVPGFLHCLPVQDNISLDIDTKLGNDILITQSSWNMLIQEPR